MNAPEPSLFDEVDIETEAAADARAEADLAEGRIISHEAMMAWLRSWGTLEESPPPQAGD
jgi:predicted transcriptional regulator